MVSVNLRVAGTLLAPDVVAVGTLLRRVDELGLAPVAEPADPLPGLLVDKVLATGRRRQGERRLLARDTLGIAPRLGENLVCLGGRDSRRHRVFDGLVLALGTAVARAFLATDMLAVDADTVGAERGLAAMAGTDRKSVV